MYTDSNKYDDLVILMFVISLTVLELIELFLRKGDNK